MESVSYAVTGSVVTHALKKISLQCHVLSLSVVLNLRMINFIFSM